VSTKDRERLAEKEGLETRWRKNERFGRRGETSGYRRAAVVEARAKPYVTMLSGGMQFGVKGTNENEIPV
jgi:hypothetical protein